MASLIWRPLGPAGARSPAWLLALSKSSGVYLYRDRATKTILYVGSSNAGRLKKTILRHVQTWGDDRSWWKQLGAFFGVADPRHWTVDRATVEVAVIPLPPSQARRREAELIERHRPPGNGAVAREEVPF